MSAVEASPAAPFSIFTKREKWALVAIASFTGSLSAFSASIYFPVIPALAKEFNVSLTLINLTITSYMIAQGIAPVIWAPLADIKGRRPVYLACLLILALSCIGLALIPAHAWWLLLVLRIFQAAGSASTIALGIGVVSDIATPAERGGFVGLTTLGPMVGPCIGPIIGGILAGELGWRWIFWFLLILAAGSFTCILLFFPETLRRVVGDGSVRPPWWNRPLVPLIGPYRRQHQTIKEIPSSPTSSISAHQSDVPSSTLTAYNLPVPQPNMNLFRLLTYPDVLTILFANALVYAVFTSIPATIATLFIATYPDQINQTNVGLCFLPMGIGCIFGVYFNGKALDWVYKRERSKWEACRQSSAQNNVGGEKGSSNCVERMEDDFHVENVRLKMVSVNLAVLLGSYVGYGWCLHARGPMGVALALSVFPGWTSIGIMNTYQTLLMDLFPKQGSSTTALNNLTRCTAGAVSMSVIDLIIKAIGIGWTHTLLGGITLVFTPALTYLEIRCGPAWRARRAGKERL